MSHKPYTAPSIVSVGSVHNLTLAGSNKYATTTPDGVLYHPPSGPAIPLTS